jgi:hypothetical protein
MIYQVRLGGKIFYDVHAKPFGCCQTKRQCAKPIGALTGGSAIRKKQLLLCPFAAKKKVVLGLISMCFLHQSWAPMSFV